MFSITKQSLQLISKFSVAGSEGSCSLLKVFCSQWLTAFSGGSFLEGVLCEIAAHINVTDVLNHLQRSQIDVEFSAKL